MELFIQNKYCKIYYDLINSRQIINSDNTSYYEKHHIIPESLGGKNDKDNIVKLTPREHFLVHWLLTKMCINPLHKRKMNFALHKMMGISSHLKRHTWSKFYYDVARKSMSEGMKNRIISAETREKMKITNKRIFNTESKEKMRLAKLGKKLSDEHKNNISNSGKGLKRKEGTGEKISKSLMGHCVTDQSKEKMKLAKLGKKQKQVECPKCGKIGGLSNMTRLHFDNCKYY